VCSLAARQVNVADAAVVFAWWCSGVPLLSLHVGVADCRFCPCEIERERERDRERQRERESERDRETQRDTEIQSDTESQRESQRVTDAPAPYPGAVGIRQSKI